MARIHETAVVEAGTTIAEDVVIGPYCCVGPHVELEAGVRLAAHVVVTGRTRIGTGTLVSPFASLGEAPQHLGYKGEPSRLDIGARNIIREHVTMNPGTEHGGMVTRIGDDGFFMVGAHIAHDCQVGSRVIMANNATLGGHVTIGDHVVVGGLSAIHQQVHVGEHAMVGGLSAVVHDIIPYGMAVGNRAVLRGLNVVGLKRRGFARADIGALREAYHWIFFGPGTMAERMAQFGAERPCEGAVARLVDFVRAPAPRPLCQPQHDEGDSEHPNDD